MAANNTVITSAVSIVGTLVLGAIVGSFIGVFERGSDALTEDQIKKVLKETLVTVIDGETKTYGEALSGISTKLTIAETRLTAMEKALGALAAD